MHQPNRKMTWIHINYEADNKIRILFVVERWKQGRYVGKHKREVILDRKNWTRMACLVRVMSAFAYHRYTIFAWDGYSVCFDRRYS